MNIKLQEIVPVPLKETITRRHSDIWNKSLTFAGGEWIKIKAPSGTGKTTLMNILYKLRHDYQGSVWWGDKELKTIAAGELAIMRQQSVSVIFQDLRLFENLTARENIEIKRVLQNPFYPAEKIVEMAEALGVTEVLDQKVSICSYGEQQRIAIIRALVQPFKWIIMDEPFSHLDLNNIQKATTLIADECRRRKAGFVLTDLDEDTHFPYTQSYSL